MRENLRGALWRLAVYAVVCVLGAFALIAVFAQLRFQSEKTYTAQFTNVSGLEGGNFVRIAGVEVGKVKSIVFSPTRRWSSSSLRPTMSCSPRAPGRRSASPT